MKFCGIGCLSNPQQPSLYDESLYDATCPPQVPKGQKSKIFQVVQHRRYREGDLPDRAWHSVPLSLTLLSPCLHSGCPTAAPVCSTKVLHTYFIFLNSLTSSSQGSNLRRELGKAWIYSWSYKNACEGLDLGYIRSRLLLLPCWSGRPNSSESSFAKEPSHQPWIIYF